MSKQHIFMSYRREDSADVSGRIYDRLAAHFGEEAIFKDVDDIPFGVNFRTYLNEMVEDSAVELVIIGPEWLQAMNSRGQRRLEDPSDFVRIEIEAALEQEIPVIPLLVRGGRMPRADDLPAELAELAYRNGTVVRADPDFHRDMDRLIRGLEGYLESRPDEAVRAAPDEAAAVRSPTRERPERSEEEARGSPMERAEVRAVGRATERANLTTIVQHVWRPSLLAGAGWGLGFALGAVLAGNTGGTGGWLFSGAIGGLATFTVLQRGSGASAWRAALAASAGWALASAILWGAADFLGQAIALATDYADAFLWNLGVTIGWTIGWAAFGALSGIAYARRKPAPASVPSLRIAAGWLLAGLLAIALLAILEDPLDSAAAILQTENVWEISEALGTLLAWVAAGSLGSGATLWLLNRGGSHLRRATG